MLHKNERSLKQVDPTPRTFLRRLAAVFVAALITLPASSALAQSVKPPGGSGPNGDRQGQQPPPPEPKRSDEAGKGGKGKGSADESGKGGKGKGSGSESGKGQGKGKGEASE